MLPNGMVLPNGIWQMQLVQINQSEDSSKITIMYDNPTVQRSITTAPTLPLASQLIYFQSTTMFD